MLGDGGRQKHFLKIAWVCRKGDAGLGRGAAPKRRIRLNANCKNNLKYLDLRRRLPVSNRDGAKVQQIRSQRLTWQRREGAGAWHG